MGEGALLRHAVVALVGCLPLVAPVPAPRCSIVIDRHNQKNAGTTLRDVLLLNQAAGHCLFWGGIGPLERLWTSFLDYLAAHPPSSDTLLRLCVEMHFPVPYFSTHFARLVAVRSLARSRGCRFVLSTRVREPLSYYLSYYRWTIVGRQESAARCWAAMGRGEGPGPSENCPAHLQATRWARDPAARFRWGTDFVSWVERTPNLQAHLLWDASASSCVESPAFAGNPSRLRLCRGWAERMGEAELKALVAMLDQFDVVGSVEAFDEALLDLQDRAGLPHVAYAMDTPHHRFWPPDSGPVPGPRDGRMCSNWTACAEAVRRAAPMDYRLYNRYGRHAGSRAMQRLGSEGPRRLQALRRARAGLDQLKSAMNGEWAAEGSGGEGPVPAGLVRYRPESALQLQGRATCSYGKAAGPPPANSTCMPVPEAVAQLWQEHHRVGIFDRPSPARARPSRILRRADPLSPAMNALAAFALRHPRAMRDAGLPALPPGCRPRVGHGLGAKCDRLPPPAT